MSDEVSTKDADLRTLLSTHAAIDDWTPIYQRVQRYPEEARRRYYRNESPLQLLVKARESKNKSESSINRIQVLRLVIDADPSSLTSRDEEGRTALHTACSSGRSWEVLQLLLEAEGELFRRLNQEGGKIKEQELQGHRSITLKTDRPGGHLPLHLVAACSSFDESSCQDSANFFPYAPCDEGAFQCTVSQSIISAYNATTVIREAYPSAVWDRDCDGETPLHAAVSWGNLGSVQALLMGAALSSLDTSCTGAKDAAQAVDDSGKTPLDRACERVCAMCVHEKPIRVPSRDNFRVSVAREDPFMSSARRDRPMNRNILLSVNQSRRRIPGVGSSFRSSFSSSIAGPTDITMLRDSFISSRQVVDPVLGLKPLCDDGHEEFAKVEMLVRAAKGHFKLGSDRSADGLPLLLHDIIDLGCPPEIVWHAATKYAHEVEKVNESGKSALFIAAEKLSHSIRLRREKRFSLKNQVSDTILQKEAADATSESDLPPVISSDASPQSGDEPISHSDLPNTNIADEANHAEKGVDIPKYQEIIDMLIKSRTFGQPHMASVPDRRGRLPIHELLGAGALWTNDSAHEVSDESSTTDFTRPNIVATLVEANPQALLTRDNETGLFPFMISATSTSEGEDECRAALETIFRLLMESPAAISLCIQKCVH